MTEAHLDARRDRFTIGTIRAVGGPGDGSAWSDGLITTENGT